MRIRRPFIQLSSLNSAYIYIMEIWASFDYNGAVTCEEHRSPCCKNTNLLTINSSVILSLFLEDCEARLEIHN